MNGVSTKSAAVRLPIAGKKGLWNWLQPYVERASGETRFNSLDVGGSVSFPYHVPPVVSSHSLILKHLLTITVVRQVDEEDTNLRHDAGPYTFLEGYLQLAKPLLKGDISV